MTAVALLSNSPEGVVSGVQLHDVLSVCILGCVLDGCLAFNFWLSLVFLILGRKVELFGEVRKTAKSKYSGPFTFHEMCTRQRAQRIMHGPQKYAKEETDPMEYVQKLACCA